MYKNASHFDYYIVLKKIFTNKNRTRPRTRMNKTFVWVLNTGVLCEQGAHLHERTKSLVHWSCANKALKKSVGLVRTRPSHKTWVFFAQDPTFVPYWYPSPSQPIAVGSTACPCCSWAYRGRDFLSFPIRSITCTKNQSVFTNGWEGKGKELVQGPHKTPHKTAHKTLKVPATFATILGEGPAAQGLQKYYNILPSPIR